MTGTSLLGALFPLAGGAAFAALYFALLHRAVRLQLEGAGAVPIVGLTLLRLGAAAAVFWALAQLGAVALIAALAGFLAVRLVAQRIVAARI